MKNWILIAGITIVNLNLAMASASWAGGLGGVVGYSYRSGELTNEEPGGGSIENLDHAENNVNFGIAYDTNLAANKLINLRSTLSLFTAQVIPSVGSQSENVPNSSTANVDPGIGVGFDQLIGFGIVRTAGWRVFAGPNIHASFSAIDDGKYEEKHWTAGGGPAIGVNLHISRNFSLSILGSVEALYGNADAKARTLGASAFRTYDGLELRAGFSLAGFFRFDSDQF